MATLIGREAFTDWHDLKSTGRGVESRSEVRGCPKPSARTIRE